MEKMRGAGAGAGAGATPFVTCELRGGLGNQLFEMYTTIAASMHLHMPFKLYNDERLGDRGTYWRTLFHRFNPLFLISRHQAGHAQRVREPSYHHTPLPVLLQSVDTSRSVLLDGYFQSAKYFESVAPTISRMLQIDVQRDQVNEKLKRVLARSGMARQPSVCIFVWATTSVFQTIIRCSQKSITEQRFNGLQLLERETLSKQCFIFARTMTLPLWKKSILRI
jgi:hypothetical protein